MTDNLSELAEDSQVRHPGHGNGTVLADLGETVVVRFEAGIEECAKSDLEKLSSVWEAISETQWDVPLEVINRIQGEAIKSINEQWGVFARSRIELLPHQLWVCRRVNSQWPTRWLVADDVGLGKTIEAGIILTPLLSEDRVQRLLVLCPASLVDQWQKRLWKMFDIRLTQYSTQADTSNSAFWDIHDSVAVSLHTLRKDHDGRHERLFDSPPWDMVVVDESHHVNATEKEGPTLAYKLVQELENRGLIKSMLFFTGTPHRGKDYGFLAQLELLRPDLFDTDDPLAEQLGDLKKVMIRNNKYNVTDIEGERLFQKPQVDSETYSYSPDERRFYDMLSDFILKGKAYASKLSASESRTAMLVLIAMQKLASSSVAAIRRALRNRLNRIDEAGSKLRRLRERYQELEELDDQDRLADLEEEIAEQASALRLMEDEQESLRELLRAARDVEDETKIKEILAILKGRFRDRTVLFFTEYKATQSLLMSALMSEFGAESVTFINGDEAAREVQMPDGTVKTLRAKKEEAAAKFNAGKARFLVSTEAGGEGIDLQENCHTLIHVDLPWNPMRLHQRVGRLNRYGQTEQVEVLSLRNPDTVETRIWQKLNSKLVRISRAFTEVMDEPEDLMQLVLGMTSTAVFRDIFSRAHEVPDEKLGDWFDEQTATFGGQDAVETVKAIVGNVSKFDFQQVSDQLPRVDLPDLQPFIVSSLTLNGRRPKEDEDGLSFKTPEAWLGHPGMRGRYEHMILDRHATSPDADKRLLGVGHRFVDRALEEARDLEASVTAVPQRHFPDPVAVFRLFDRVTDTVKRPVVMAVRQSAGGDLESMQDWELLRLLNDLPYRSEKMLEPAQSAENEGEVRDFLSHAQVTIEEQVPALDLGFRMPACEPLAIVWPG